MAVTDPFLSNSSKVQTSILLEGAEYEDDKLGALYDDDGGPYDDEGDGGGPYDDEGGPYEDDGGAEYV